MKQIDVTIILKGYLMWHSDDKKKIHDISVEEGTKIETAIALLHVPRAQINVVLKDGEKVDLNTVLKEDDRIEVVPILAGG